MSELLPDLSAGRNAAIGSPGRHPNDGDGNALHHEIVPNDELLHILSCQLIEEEDSRALYEKFIDAANSIMRSTHACLQIYHPERGPGGALRLLSSRGFSAEAAVEWEWVPADATTTCAEALRRGTRVVTSDIAGCDFLTGTVERQTYLDAGVRAAQTTPLVSRSGKTVGMISTFWPRTHIPSEQQLRHLDLLARQAADLIERTQTIEVLRSNENRLKEADRRKDEFLALLAHELRNPLAPIRTGLEVIRRAGNNASLVEEARSMMERQVGHMVRLIDDLLDVSRIRSGKIELHRKPILLRELIDSALEATTAAFSDKFVSFDVVMPAEPVWLDADPTRFSQIVSNVLHNAVKFSHSGGRVSISVDVVRSVNDNSGKTRITITDSGAGISAGFLPQAFELFTQDNPGNYGTHSGLGIGLALARQLIELHDGTIEAHSGGLDQGSAFIIEMPISIDATAQSASPSLPEPQPLARRVLVIDDNRDAANAMSRLVKVMGSECRVAYSGEAGLFEIAAFRPDLVFLDISMPKMDGYEVCRRIRRDANYEVTLVALTGWGQERNKQEAEQAGFDLHLTKPPDPAALETLLTAPALSAVFKDICMSVT